jgi:hypothetical protein
MGGTPNYGMEKGTVSAEMVRRGGRAATKARYRSVQNRRKMAAHHRTTMNGIRCRFGNLDPIQELLKREAFGREMQVAGARASAATR